MKLRNVSGYLCVLLSLTACDSNSDTSESASQHVAPSQGEDSATAKAADAKAAASFGIQGKEACQILPLAKLASVWGTDAGKLTASSQRDKDDQKVCRYTLDGEQVVLVLAINFNDRQDVKPHQYSQRLATALNVGLPLAGFKDKVQKFEKVSGLGTEAGFSGNLPDNQNLVLRLREDYLINLELSAPAEKQPEDVQQKLVALAKSLVD